MTKLFTLVLGCFAITAQAQDCSVANIDFGKASDLMISPDSLVSFKQAFDECDEKNTFLGSPVNGKCSTDKNRVERIQEFPDGTLVIVAKAAVDGDGSELSKSKHGSFSPNTSLKLSGGKNLDAENVPYVAFPNSGPGFSFRTQAGVSLGDIVVVESKGRCAVAIFGDIGEYFRIGEISMKVHEELGHPQCIDDEKPCKKLKGRSGEGVSIDDGVTYIVFPRSRPKGLTVEDVSGGVESRGAELLSKFKGKYSYGK